MKSDWRRGVLLAVLLMTLAYHGARVFLSLDSLLIGHAFQAVR
jgi:hypothetical protein